MKTIRTLKPQTHQLNRSVFLFHSYGIKQHHSKIVDTPEEARKIGKIMAQKVAKKLKLNLDI